jgi:hypothetical protein
MNYKIPLEQREEIKEIYSKRTTVHDVLSHFNITRHQYLYAIKNKTPLGKQILMWRYRVSKTELAQKYKVGRGTIDAILKGKHPRKKREPTGKHKKEKRLCLNCGNEVLLKGRKYCSKVCSSHAVSKRMKETNPMKNKNTALKVGKIIKQKYKNGEIKKVIGKDHWLYKGNRGLNLEIRTRLYPAWTKLVLERDKFRCTKCDKRTTLQVHHIRPLRDIIDLFLTKKLSKEELIREVIKEHKLSDGITLCKKCHSEIDERYRIKCK